MASKYRVAISVQTEFLKLQSPRRLAMDLGTVTVGGGSASLSFLLEVHCSSAASAAFSKRGTSSVVRRFLIGAGSSNSIHLTPLKW